jgi:hypothetical protein
MGRQREQGKGVAPAVVLAFGMLATAFLVGMRFFITSDERQKPGR